MEILRELHSSVAKSCEASFDIAYKDLQHELDHCHARVREAEHKQRAAEIRIQELQRDISVLREELSLYEVDTRGLELPRAFANLEEDFAPKHVWKSDHDHDYAQADSISQQAVVAKYTALYANLQTFIQTWSGLKARVMQHKKKLRQWDKQLERDEFTLMRNGASVTFRRVQNDTAGVTDNKDKTQNSSLSWNQPHQTQEGANDGSHGADSTSASSPNQASATNRDSHIKIEGDSQNTVRAEPLRLPSTQSTSSRCDATSSGPCSDVLSARPSVQPQKRKRMPPLTHSDDCSLSHGHPQDEVPRHAVSIKMEPMSSSPIRQQPYYLGQLPPGSQDLDEIGSTVPTPTKRKVFTRGIYTEEPPLTNDDAEHFSSYPARPDRQPSQQPSVLQPVDGNARTVDSGGQDSGAKRRKRSAISRLAEDGEEEGRDMGTGKRPPENTSAMEMEPRKTKSVGNITQRRLHDLLEGSMPSKSPLWSPNRNENATPQSKRRLLESSLPGQISLQPNNNFTTQTDPNDDFPDARPQDEPFRAIPLHRLNLNHFKINPARNQGLDFAYDAVVRKKDERKCLPGCTRPGCCGDKFRDIVRLGGFTGAPAGAGQEESDRRILEEYLGDDKHLIDKLSGQDRENLLVEARTRVLANKYGRHRPRHQRARSPVGFWRTGMPDTQELEADREAARQMEQEKIEERYREAMRPGGMWTWADE